jgi:iron complex transport system ATP-binding protein
VTTIPGGNAALAVHDLRVRLGGRDVLQDVTLYVPTGAWTCVVGPNGAGKTTLLHACAGLVERGGTVELFGRRIDAYRRRERSRLVALVPQQPVIPDAMTVRAYVSLGRTPHVGPLGAERRADVAAVASALERLDLAWAADRRLDTLSGGELQRAVLARALAQEAPLLLLDEPTTGLDLGHQVRVLELVDELRRQERLTIVSAMHDLTLAGRFCDRFVLLSGGRVVAAGRRSDVLDAAVISEHFGASVHVIGEGDLGWAVVPSSRRADRP